MLYRGHERAYDQPIGGACLTPVTVVHSSPAVTTIEPRRIHTKIRSAQIMIYIICTSGLHRSLAKEIEKKHTQKCITLSLDKKNSVSGKVSNIFKVIPVTIKCLFDKNSHVIIPHPFNPWFSLFILISKKQSIFDDGIAYYYDAKIPSNLFCVAYLILSKKLNKNLKLRELKKTTFRDYLESCSATFYYCMYPSKSKIESIKKIEIRPEQVFHAGNTKYVIFLDTHKDVAQKINKDGVISFLKKIALSSDAQKIYFKPHPRSPSAISEELNNKIWAQELKKDYELTLVEQKVDALYSIYSSATLITKIIQPDSKVYCFTNKCLQSVSGQIHEFFEQENVSFIEIK